MKSRLDVKRRVTGFIAVIAFVVVVVARPHVELRLLLVAILQHPKICVAIRMILFVHIITVVMRNCMYM